MLLNQGKDSTLEPAYFAYPPKIIKISGDGFQIDEERFKQLEKRYQELSNEQNNLSKELNKLKDQFDNFENAGCQCEFISDTDIKKLEWTLTFDN